jgi:GTP-binding protein
MFIDEIKLHLKAGHGGNGVVRWRHEKGKEFSGPSGGDGGRGAHIFIRAVRDLNLLYKYRNVKELKGERGEDGKRNSQHGKDGNDLTVDLPLGSIITNLSSGERFNFSREGELIKILSGGRGGFGNEHFKSSINIRPKEFTLGKYGEEADFYIELELIADISLVGLPNAGKTSLLNVLTGTSKKVGDYPFTTLEPNLGNLFGFIIADVPGLIEDSSLGKGLGFKFLRHIKRSKILLHCVSLENKDIIKAYKTVRKEIKDYSEDLSKKPQLIAITKSDLASEEEIVKIKNLLKREANSKTIFIVSIKNPESVKKMSDELIKILRNLNI